MSAVKEADVQGSRGRRDDLTYQPEILTCGQAS